MIVSERIGKWYDIHKRTLPWRESGNPYYIWVSEIILQQTRVQQGMSYYLRFIEKFPTIFILSESSVEQVLLIWQGLGYYSRARNMHKTAKIIVTDYKGNFPEDYKQLLKLPGIGEYTAGAIASLAFKQPFPAIDGNVYRVLSRFFGIESAINSSGAKKDYYQLALKIMDKKKPGRHNQAIIELGALVCLPRNPNCFKCPLNESCFAFNNNRIADLPKKNKLKSITHRYFYYLVIRKSNSVFIKQRGEKDIWALLYDFLQIETKHSLSLPEELLMDKKWSNIFRNRKITIRNISSEFVHQLSHQTIHAWFIEVEVGKDFTCTYDSVIEVKNSLLEEYPFPRLIETYLMEG